MSGSMCFTSTLKIEEEEIMVTKKQGIISILGSDDDKNKNNNNNNNNNITKKASSLRRTLSADMSSRKWLTQNGFNNSSTLKKTASSLNLIPVSITEDSPTQSDVWNSIQQEKNEEKTGKFDIWDSIISQKVDQQVGSEPALYIHPLVKRSKSSLSEKSLEICTESLGSETGSDGFSSYPASETSDDDEQQQQGDDETTMKNNSVNYYVKKPEKKSFPPPIPSLSLRREGGPAATLRMKSHRNNGRLVLEAVPVPQQNTNFNAQRQGGRLVLTFAGQNNKHDVNANKFEDDDDTTDSEIDEETEEMMDDRYVFEEKPKKNNLSGGMINVHRLALMMNKPMALPNRNPTIWSNKFNVDQVKPTAIAQSLPPRPPRLIPSQPPSVAAGAASLNAYEYYWRPEPMGPQSLAKSIYNIDNKKSVLSQSGRQILRRNKGGYIVPLSKGCKEPRRPSLVFWEPCCITTS